MPRRQRPWKRGARGPVPRRPLLRQRHRSPLRPPQVEVIDAARPDDGRAIVPAAVVEPTPEGNAIARFFRRLFGK